jgi:transposase
MPRIVTKSRLYAVTLTPEERADLQAFLRKGKANGRKYARARILLLADEYDVSDEALAELLHVSADTVLRTRKKFVAGGVAHALAEKPRPGAPRRFDEETEQLVVALAGDAPPVGHEVWTMQLLADTLVELAIVAAVSDETVRVTLKKTTASPGRARNG